MDEFIFEKLEVWSKACDLVSQVYKLIEGYPSYEKFSLCDQIRRAAISIVSNIAEGSGRVSIKEKIHFIEIAYGSLLETFCQLSVSVNLNYLSKASLDEVRPRFIEVSKMLSGWRNNLKSKI